MYMWRWGWGKIRWEEESIADFGVKISPEENTVLTSKETIYCSWENWREEGEKSHRTLLIDNNQFNDGLMGSEHLPKF